MDICANRHKGNPESVAANPLGKVKTLQHGLILHELKVNHYTAEELEGLTGIGRSSVSARCSELLALGEIMRVGRRLTKSGKQASVLAIKPQDMVSDESQRTM
jgi:hypothetical protein